MNDQRTGANDLPATDSDSSEDFYKLRNEEIRALCDKSLTHGAARLFVLISKLIWFPNLGGRFKQMTGVLSCPISDFARYLGCNEKSFYRDSQHNRPGWLELLTAGNYIWITKNIISNGEAMNVYHVTVLCPRNEQVTFGFASRFHAHPTGENGNGPFSVPNSRGTSEVAQTGNQDSPKRELATGANGASPLVKTVTRNRPKRVLTTTVSASVGVVKTDTANSRFEHLPTGENGNGQLVKAGELNKSVPRVERLNGKNGDALPPDLAQEAIKDGDGAFADWCESWDDEKRYKWEKELGRIRMKLQTQPGPFWQRRADFLRMKLDGGRVPVAKPMPARAVKPIVPRLTDEQRDALSKNIGTAMRAAVNGGGR